MKYRVGFTLGAMYYYTEWFETLDEAKEFSVKAMYNGIHVNQIEDEDGEVI